MTGSLGEKAFVVTGASEGIGFAVAKCLSQASAKIFITGRRQEVVQAAAARIGPNVIPIVTDGGRVEDIRRLFGRVGNEVDALDAVIANAGVIDGNIIGNVTEQDFDRVFDTNVKGTLFTVQCALPLLRDGASIVLLSSVHAFKGNPASSVYSASKAAIRSFARNWILDLADRRIRVNVVSPGAIRTEGFERLFPNDEVRDPALGYIAGVTPSRRVGDAVDVAEAVRFLISEEASFINGADLHVDGGLAQI